MIALAWLACTPAPPTPEEADRLARALEPVIDGVEARVANEVDARFDRFVCRPPDGTFQRQDSIVCIEQKGAWERGRMTAIGQLGPALGAMLDAQVVGVGVLVPEVGEASAGVRPHPAVSAEEGARMDVRWYGWGADRSGPFVETLRKMTVDGTPVAVRVIARPAAP